MLTTPNRTHHLALLLVLTVFPQQGSGHHSFSARFDVTRTAEIKGKVTRVKWRNPHVLFSVEVVSETGTVESWGIEAHAAVALKRMGLARDMINVGDVVRIAGYPTRRPMPQLFGTNILVVPLSEQAELVERFTPSNDGSRLDYQLTVRDPITFTEPVVRDHYWLYLPNLSVQPFRCETSEPQ